MNNLFTKLGMVLAIIGLVAMLVWAEASKAEEYDATMRPMKVVDLRLMALEGTDNAVAGLGGYLVGIHEVIVLLAANGSKDLGVQTCGAMPTPAFTFMVNGVLENAETSYPNEMPALLAIGQACTAIGEKTI